MLFGTGGQLFQLFEQADAAAVAFASDLFNRFEIDLFCANSSANQAAVGRLRDFEGDKEVEDSGSTPENHRLTSAYRLVQGIFMIGSAARIAQSPLLGRAAQGRQLAVPCADDTLVFAEKGERVGGKQRIGTQDVENITGVKRCQVFETITAAHQFTQMKCP
jgi:hypothetical protein